MGAPLSLNIAQGLNGGMGAPDITTPGGPGVTGKHSKVSFPFCKFLKDINVGD